MAASAAPSLACSKPESARGEPPPTRLRARQINIASNRTTDNVRRRLLRDTTPLQRGIIRHLILIVDLSAAMAEKDLRPTRHLLTLRYAQEFVTEFFEQNPISQLGVLGMRDGLAARVSDMSGNPAEHGAALQALRAQEPKGQPSLQNALEMARGALFHAPSHGTREVVVVFGALLSSDPGDIHVTLKALVADRIRVGVVGLAAQVAICRELVVKTNDGDDSTLHPALSFSLLLPCQGLSFLVSR